MGYLLGIDLGTSRIKVIIIDVNGATAGSCSVGYPIDCVKNGYADQMPQTWWKACCEGVQRALRTSGVVPDKVLGVGLSGQMHGLVVLDRQHRAIRPSIIHCDARSGSQATRIIESLGPDQIKSLLMNYPHTGFLLPSLMWLRENETDHYTRAAHVILPKDYLRLKFTGEIGTDFSDASATLAFDLANGCWSDEIINMFELRRSLFPEIHPSREIAGSISIRAADQTGLRPGTPVVFGGADQVMQSIGCGAIRAGQATVNIGSGGQVCIQTNRPLAHPESGVNTFCGVDQRKWYLMGASTSSGSALQWLCNSILLDNDFAALDEHAEKIRPGSDGLLFLPYLNGERCPHLNFDVSGAFLGLSYRTDRARLFRAVMEGVAYSLLDCIHACEKAGESAEELIALGGGSCSREWLRIQANVFNLPIRTTLCDEPAALGAAITAGVGIGCFPSYEKGCDAAVKYNEDILLPDPAAHATYAQYYEVFNEMYIAGKQVMSRLTSLGRAEQ